MPSTSRTTITNLTQNVGCSLLSVVARRTYLIDFLFEPPSLAPHYFRLLLIPPRDSSTVHDAPWDFIRCPQFLLKHQILRRPTTRIQQRVSIWRTEWPSMRNLTISITSAEVLGDMSTELRRRTVGLQGRLVWIERNIRPPKEVVAGPVPNAGSSLMLPVTDNEYYNSLVSDKSALNCSRKAMMQDAWNGMTRISLGSRRRVLWQVVSHLALRLPLQQTCVFHKSMFFHTTTTDLHLASVMSGWTAWVGGDFPCTKFDTPAFDGCV